MMNLSTLRNLVIPEGKVVQIKIDGKVAWTNEPAVKYTVTFNSNGGDGSMSALTGSRVTLASNAFSRTGYNFTGWNTKADGSGTSYSNGQVITLSSDLTLYAQWSIKYYTVTYRHSYDDATGFFGSGDTGPQECYAFAINGTQEGALGAFSNSAKTYSLPYGTKLAVAVAVEKGDDRSYINWNGNTVSGKSNLAYWEWDLSSNVDIHFEWNYFLKDDLWAGYPP